MDEFRGLPERECGEHRTVGGRAWCFDCSEWCYPDLLCPGCESPRTPAFMAKVHALHEAAEHALVVLMRPEAWGEVENLRGSLSDALRAFTADDLARIGVPVRPRSSG